MRGCKLQSLAWKSARMDAWGYLWIFGQFIMKLCVTVAYCCQHKGLFILRSVVACLFHMYTRGLKDTWCQTIWSVFASSFFLYFIHHHLPLCLWAEADETGHFSPYCPVRQALLWGKKAPWLPASSDCYRTAGSTPMEPQNTNETSHLQQWLSVFLQNKLQLE